MTFVILKVLDMAMGLRVSEEEEIVGPGRQPARRARLPAGRRRPGYAGIPVVPEAISYAPPVAAAASQANDLGKLQGASVK